MDEIHRSNWLKYEDIERTNLPVRIKDWDFWEIEEKCRVKEILKIVFWEDDGKYSWIPLGMHWIPLVFHS